MSVQVQGAVIVFNHSVEGGSDGPIFSFRGLDNDIYYLMMPDGLAYRDYSGCGNTLNCNHPVVRSLILDCLRRWVVHTQVDGFLRIVEDSAAVPVPPRSMLVLA